VVQRRKQWRNGTLFAVYLLQIFPNVTEGLTMKRRGLIAFAAAGVIIGGAWLITATAIRAQQPPPAPAAPPTQAVPPIGPADPNLRVVPLPDGKKIHLLPATLETTQWGWFDNAQPPVLRINSGDTVALETMMHSHNQVVPGTTIEQIKKLRTDHPGRGPHTITGPIYIEGAEPGDVLKLTINKIVPRTYGVNFNVPGMFGQFPKEYQDGQVKYLYLDWDRKVTEFLPGVLIPLKPFPGILGVARKEPGRYSTVPPGEFGGNLDIRDLVEGTALYVPVFVRGALLWSGDSHASQGNGEVNLTAIETAYKELNITVEVIKGRPLDFPRIETSKSWITVGLDQDLNKAWDQAKAQTIKFLAEQRKVSPEQAAKLMVQVSDCRVTQVVDVKKGVHCLNPKNPSAREDMERPTKETAKYYVSHAKDADLNKAMDTASMGMIKWLESEKKIARLDAYGLASVAMDCRIGAVSDAEKNVHCLLPKSIFVAKR
jgi:acetamidase/formamidase